MPATLTTITGTICNAAGAAVEGAHIRAKIQSTKQDQGGQVASGAGISSGQVEAFTDNAGFFSIDLVAGAVILLEIPDINLSKEILVPAAGPVDFTTLI